MELVLLSKLGGQEVRQEYILIAWCNAIILVKKTNNPDVVTILVAAMIL